MERFENLISYFCEYDLYNNMLSNAIKDKKAKDVLLEQCDFAFLTTNMFDKKADKIWNIVKKKLNRDPTENDKKQIRSYVERSITLEILFQKLSIQTFNRKELTEKVNQVQEDQSFFLYYPVFLNRAKKTQQSLLTFSGQLLENAFQINKIYVNRDIVALLVAQQKQMEIADARSLYEEQIDDAAFAVDALHPSQSIYELYQLVCREFNRIFNAELMNFQNTKEWQMLEKAVVSFEPPDNVIDNCFRDELGAMERFNLQDHILPDTVKQYLRMSKREAINIADVHCTASHLGSYQAQYPINKKQWELVQLAKHTRLLCVEGPPGTGKTTMLKEMIADILIEKANTLLKIWDNDWDNPRSNEGEIRRSPLQGKNLNSIVISSTNNKAIDNIGLDLLKEVPYFSDVAQAIACEEDRYAGILCARLGNSENVKDFYNAFFKPLCEHLSSHSMGADDADRAKLHYMKLFEKLERINEKVSELLTLREQLEPSYCLENLEEKKGQLEKELQVLTEQGCCYESRISALKETQEKLNERCRCAEKNITQHQKAVESAEDQLHDLYTDLREYEEIGQIKRAFRFLFPKARVMLEKYGSAEQIRDLIQDSKKHRENNIAQIEEMHDLLAKVSEQQEETIKEIYNLTIVLDENSKKCIEITGQHILLSDYCNCIICLGNQTDCPADSLMNMDAYQLRNVPRIIELRNDLFIAAVHLMEAYIYRQKVPILNNLSIFLKEQSGENSCFIQWCQTLYNGDNPYPENKAELVRTLWETFFLCFPVVTTTLHSFRRSTFQMIPNLFDVLMVDESGQIIPYYVLAPLYRARRAVFVGDVNQIEPIKNVPPRLLEKKYTERLGNADYSRFCLDSASAQTYAAAASEYYEKVQDQIGGIILNEHMRCEPAIMAFSNQYIYHNVLALKGKDDLEKLFGNNLVAFDIRGSKAAQHYNQAEIDACKEIIGQFVKTYGEGIKKEIGIITPFAQQAARLREAIPEVEIGTVHVFQGAEKKYILFSGVIDERSGAGGLSRFIGGKGNLLNVAFSRAKKQFIYVGNLQAAVDAKNYLKDAENTIREKGKVFSLFDTNREESITDKDVIRILTGTQSVDTNDEIGIYLKKVIPYNIIDTPRMHNEILSNLLLMATNSIYVVSPWIGSNVVTENMLDAMKTKLENSISIHIMFGYKAKECSLEDIDELVRQDIPWGREGAAGVIRSLKNLLGNELKYDPPSHVKLLLVDDKYLFIGSLNWLYNSGKMEQKEISCLITNSDTIKYVKERFLY